MPRSRAVSSHASRAAKCCQRAARLSVRAPMRRENEGRRRRGERTSRRARWARSTAAKMATATADDRYVDASSRAMRRSNSLEAVAAWDDSQATRGHEIRVHAVLREPSHPRETSRWRARPRRRPRVLAEGIDPRGEAERVSGTRVRVRAARDLAQTQTTSKRASNRRRIFFSRAARFPPSFPRRRSSRRRRANSTRRRRETSSWRSTSRRSRTAKTS